MIFCKCFEVEKVKRLWKNSGINIDNLDKLFSNFKEWFEKLKEMKFKVVEYYKRFRNIRREVRNLILFCGNFGSGKIYVFLVFVNNFLKKDI